VKIVFVQPQFDQASAEILASSIGGAVLSMDPLAQDVVDNFSRMADTLEKALR
jgi:zinc transport system substrate-binding protein